jgi:hypothetical protein
MSAEKHAGGTIEVRTEVAAILNTHPLGRWSTTERTRIQSETVGSANGLPSDNNNVIERGSTIHSGMRSVTERNSCGRSIRAITALNLQGGDNGVAGGDCHGAGTIGVNNNTNHTVIRFNPSLDDIRIGQCSRRYQVNTCTICVIPIKSCNESLNITVRAKAQRHVNYSPKLPGSIAK